MIEIIEHGSLAEALLFAQSEYEPLKKDKVVRVETRNGHYEYKYADLDMSRKVTDPILMKHGLVVRDRVLSKDGKEYLVSTITHVTTGESEESEIDISTDGDMKTLGGNITYARRYNYWNLTGRIGEDDSEPRDLSRRSSSRQPQQQVKSGAGATTPSSTGQKPAGGKEELEEAKKEYETIEKTYLVTTGDKRADLRKKLFKGLNLPSDVDILNQARLVIKRMLDESGDKDESASGDGDGDQGKLC